MLIQVTRSNGQKLLIPESSILYIDEDTVLHLINGAKIHIFGTFEGFVNRQRRIIVKEAK